MKIVIVCIVLIFSTLSLWAQENSTPTYKELISEYTRLQEANPKTTKLDSFGTTDSGNPLNCLIINAQGIFEPDSIDGAIVMIMNGIHPGEACGINASLLFSREKALAPDENVTYCVIPIYNIGGGLNRNSYTRANQNGPEAYGFRGNARNLDLNRDFIKADSKNTLGFYELFQKWQPHIFIDTHTSNGADYQPVITLLTTFPEKLEAPQQHYLKTDLEPKIFSKMTERGTELIPYVNSIKSIPDYGIAAFTDHPRYSIGYVSLFHTIGFTTEAHMLKPFYERVQATHQFLNSISEIVSKDYQKIVKIKKECQDLALTKSTVPFDWKVSNHADSIEFPGFEADTTIISRVTGLPTLRYDRKKPYRRNIAYYNQHDAVDAYSIPKYYVLSRAMTGIIELLDKNKIEYSTLYQDTVILVDATYIKSYSTSPNPYEGHYPHFDIEYQTISKSIIFHAGDLIIPTRQSGKKYLAHVFNIKAADSFFKWNYFDSFLGQKEYFSSYVFDETAAKILDENPDLKENLEIKKGTDSLFAANSRMQLNFIYQHSRYYEQTHLRMPVFAIPEN